MNNANYEDIVSTYIKIPECGINKENYFQREMKFKSFSRGKGFQDALNRGVNPPTTS